METGYIDHIGSLIEKRSSFRFTCEDNAELKDSLESLLPVSDYDLLSIKGFDVPQIHTQKSIQGFIADIKVDLNTEGEAEAYYNNYCSGTKEVLRTATTK